MIKGMQSFCVYTDGHFRKGSYPNYNFSIFMCVCYCTVLDLFNKIRIYYFMNRFGNAGVTYSALILLTSLCENDIFCTLTL